MDIFSKEQGFLYTIKQNLADSSYIGDDCAFLDEFGIFVTQDTLVEGVHFSLDTITPFQLGVKSVAVNISDLAAVCSLPSYITISLSLPNSFTNSFVSEFYNGINYACELYHVKVVGGDLTGSEKIVVSITAISKKYSDISVSRSFANVGDIVFVTGTHGDSAGGLLAFANNIDSEYLKNKHLKPCAQVDKSKKILGSASRDFAMMDSSDGLGDALYKLALNSGVSIRVDFNKLPVSMELKSSFPKNWEQLCLWGGEDYELVGCINPSDFFKLDVREFFPIGEVVEAVQDAPVIINKVDSVDIITDVVFANKSFNHFKNGETFDV